MFLKPADVVAAVTHGRRVDKPFMEVERRRNRFHNELLKSPFQPRKAVRPVITIDNQLGDQAVIIGRHGIAGIEAGIDADAGAARRMIGSDSAGRRHEGFRMFGIDPALDGMTGEGHILLREGQRHAGRDPDLLANEIDAGDGFGDRVFDLKTGVHLDEEKLTILIEELHGTDAKIAHAACRLGRDAADLGALFSREHR